MKGRTVSITIPKPLFDDYNQQAEKLKISRSKVICNILINEYNIRKAEENYYEGVIVNIKDKPVEGE